MNPVRIYELDTAWNRRFSGSAKADRGRREKRVLLLTLILMGDWCRQVGTTRSETDTDKPKEIKAKEEIGMTLLI